MKRNIRIRLVVFILIVLLLLMLVIGGILIYSKYNRSIDLNFESRIQSVREYKVADAKTVGWIQVMGTNIDYPVIQETNSAYDSGIDYLWQTSSYKIGENREAIYGHNILNVSNTPLINAEGHTRFENLMGFVYEDFAKENLYIQYTHDKVDYIYKIYAVSFLSLYEEHGSSMSDDDEVEEYIEKARKISLYDYDIEVDSGDELISLITCTRYFGINGKTQFRVDARRVRKNENTSKYGVQSNDNYDIIIQDRRSS